ncbi:MAG: Holliday junction branch migration protein RuvA [Lachnospiraceae bacterium]|nr:Holliday junction branch migration protein RuvA [Lachnospiraceae bacterium]
MIGYLKGEVAAIYDDRIIIEVGGIGYNVFMPASSLDLIEGCGTFVKIYTYLLVREDALQLYGFLTKDDLELYRMLISVNGIGPKGALALLSVMTCDELRFAILAGDAKQIGKAPGIGPKSAQRVIIDLKDKIDTGISFDTADASTGRTDDNTTLSGIREEAAQALIALGYSSTESYKAVRSVGSDVSDDVETVLKKALSLMSKF